MGWGPGRGSLIVLSPLDGLKAKKLVTGSVGREDASCKGGKTREVRRDCAVKAVVNFNDVSGRMGFPEKYCTGVEYRFEEGLNTEKF